MSGSAGRRNDVGQQVSVSVRKSNDASQNPFEDDDEDEDEKESEDENDCESD